MLARNSLVLIGLILAMSLAGCSPNDQPGSNGTGDNISLKKDVRTSIEAAALQTCSAAGTSSDVFACESARFDATRRPQLTQDEKNAGILDRLCGHLVVMWAQAEDTGEVWAPAVFEQDRLGWHGLTGWAVQLDADAPVLDKVLWAQKGCGPQEDFAQTQAAVDKKNILPAADVTVLVSEIEHAELQRCITFASSYAGAACNSARLQDVVPALPSLSDRSTGVTKRLCGILIIEFTDTGGENLVFAAPGFFDRGPTSWQASYADSPYNDYSFFDGEMWQAKGCGTVEDFNVLWDRADELDQ